MSFTTARMIERRRRRSGTPGTFLFGKQTEVNYNNKPSSLVTLVFFASCECRRRWRRQLRIANNSEVCVLTSLDVALQPKGSPFTPAFRALACKQRERVRSQTVSLVMETF